MVLSHVSMAQGQDPTIEMADQMRADGKIYVVVAVLVIILLGLLLYIFRLDRQVAQLEQFLASKTQHQDHPAKR